MSHLALYEAYINGIKEIRLLNAKHEMGGCFLCITGNQFYEGNNASHVHRLHEILDYVGEHSNVSLAEQLHLYFKTNVYKANQDMPMLTKEIALEHIQTMCQNIIYK